MYSTPERPQIGRCDLTAEGRLLKSVYKAARSYVERLGEDMRALAKQYNIDRNPAKLALDTFLGLLPEADRKDIFEDIVVQAFAERGVCRGRGDWVLPARK